MFSIIDNEINVNFEILGGKEKVTGTAKPSSTQADPQQTNTGSPAPASLVAEAESYGVTVAQIQGAIGELTTAGGHDAAVATLQALAAAMAHHKGGSLDDALSKDIQIELIGGVYAPSSELWDIFAGLPAVMRFNVAGNTPFCAAIWQLMLNVRIGANTIEGDQWRPEQSVPQISDITRRSSNGKLEVKVGDKYVSLNEYFSSANNGGLTQAQVDGRADIFADNWIAQEAECFAAGASMWNEDGTVARADCLNAINQKGLWRIGATDVAKMHPKSVFDILKSLGFKGVPTSKGVRCQSYSSWSASLKDSQKKDANVLTNANKGLLFTGNQFVNAEFVKNLVAYMNANPSILNKGDLGVDSKADKYGVKAATWNKRVDHSFDDLRYRVNDAYDTVRFRIHGLTGAFPAGFMSFRGGAAPAYLFPTRSNNRVENLPKFSAQLRSIFDSLERRLKSNNKTLGQTTKDDIEKIFKSLEKHEESAVLLIKQLESYYLTNRGDRGHAVVSNSAMAKALENFEKNMHKLRKRAINVIDIQTVLNTAVNDAESAQSDFGSFKE